MNIVDERIYNVSQIFEILKERGLELSKPTIREYIRMIEPLLRTMNSASRSNSFPSGAWLIDGRGVVALIKFIELQGRKYKHGKKGNIEKKIAEVVHFIKQEDLLSPESPKLELERGTASLAIVPRLRKEIKRLQRRVSENRTEIKRIRRELEKLRG